MKIIETDCFGIVVTLTGDKLQGGTITSDLHELGDEPDMDTDPDAHLYGAAMDAIESMVLAHAVAGIDITDPKYLDGIETAVQALAVKFG